MTSTHCGPIALICLAAASISASEPMVIPVSSPASSRFGVTTVASGSSRSLTASSVPADSRLSPCLDTATGSTTTGAATSARASLTMPTSSGEASMPVLIACAPMSPSTESSWARDGLGRQLPVTLDTDGVLRCHGADDRHAVHAEGQHRLQVGLNARAAA